MKKRYVDFNRLLDLQAWKHDPLRTFVDSLGGSQPKRKKKVKKKPQRTVVKIEEISDGNL